MISGWLGDSMVGLVMAVWLCAQITFNDYIYCLFITVMLDKKPFWIEFETISIVFSGLHLWPLQSGTPRYLWKLWWRGFIL